MRRRSTLATDSMDLLLDTITNTFGGILLLALLLVLLIRQTTNQETTTQAADSADIQRLQSRIDELTATRSSLQQSLAAQQITSQLTPDAASQQLQAFLVELGYE